MLPFQSYYGFDQQEKMSHEPPNLVVNFMDGGDSTMSSASKVERKSEEACRSHKEAERRRRQRINAHLSTLRTLLPNTTKTDKASLLAEVVHHVKELRKRADDMAKQDGDTWVFPSESDEASLSYFDDDGDGGDNNNNNNCKEMKAILCCEDRPGLNVDLARAIRAGRARAVRAEMMTVGGRTKSVVVVKWAESIGGEEEIGALKRALKAVVENRVSDSGLSRVVSGSKRARVYGSVNEEGDNEFF
ncbi:transcription factor bHLH30-like [Quercus lobata]|uniref:BHLH domain-containing protein n=1 Tax=Quercus lobata TaxID=97700 RepID=A0A7N2RAG6_QUELO|nr:transcription factor bHLH30-like [Quercus lobata]